MLKTFTRGGVHPPQNKITSDCRIEDLPLPVNVAIPVSMHLGVPSKPVVDKGAEIKVGQLIAKGDGFVSANIHSPFSGKVVKIDKSIDISGYKRDAVFITVEGDNWLDTIDRSPVLKREFNHSPEELIKIIGDAGIVGMGGATFPSHVKLTVPKGKTVNTLVINGAECEPYLTSDHVLMLEKGEEILTGAAILMKALRWKRLLSVLKTIKPMLLSIFNHFLRILKASAYNP